LGHPAQEAQELLEKGAVYGIRIGVVHDLFSLLSVNGSTLCQAFILQQVTGKTLCKFAFLAFICYNALIN